MDLESTPPETVIVFPKARRFFYHFRKVDRHMTIHFDGACLKVWDVICEVPCHTKRNKRQPYLVLQGMAKRVTLRHTPEGLCGIISNFPV